MIDCPRADIRDLLPDWVNGSLAPAARATVAEHLAACDPCAAEAELLRGARAVLAQVPAVNTARIAAAVRAATVASRTRPAAWHSWHSWRDVSGIAALAAGLLAVVLGVREAGVRKEREPQAPSVASHDTGLGSTAGGGLRQSDAELFMEGGVGGLNDDDLRTLLDRLDRVEALPSDTPEPVGATLGESTT